MPDPAVSSPPRFADRLGRLSDETKVPLLGVTSAEIIISDLKTLGRIVALAAVYLVDMSAEAATRADLGQDEVNINDVYWWLAGLPG